MQVNRLSSCCEYKHRKGSRLGGKGGYFGFVCVERSSPCYKYGNKCFPKTKCYFFPFSFFFSFLLIAGFGLCRRACASTWLIRLSVIGYSFQSCDCIMVWPKYHSHGPSFNLTKCMRKGQFWLLFINFHIEYSVWNWGTCLKTFFNFFWKYSRRIEYKVKWEYSSEPEFLPPMEPILMGEGKIKFQSNSLYISDGNMHEEHKTGWRR